MFGLLQVRGAARCAVTLRKRRGGQAAVRCFIPSSDQHGSSIQQNPVPGSRPVSVSMYNSAPLWVKMACKQLTQHLDLKCVCYRIPAPYYEPTVSISPLTDVGFMIGHLYWAYRFPAPVAAGSPNQNTSRIQNSAINKFNPHLVYRLGGRRRGTNVRASVHCRPGGRHRGACVVQHWCCGRVDVLVSKPQHLQGPTVLAIHKGYKGKE